MDRVKSGSLCLDGKVVSVAACREGTLRSRLTYADEVSFAWSKWAILLGGPPIRWHSNLCLGCRHALLHFHHGLGRVFDFAFRSSLCEFVALVILTDRPARPARHTVSAFFSASDASSARLNGSRLRGFGALYPGFFGVCGHGHVRQDHDMNIDARLDGRQ